MYMYNSTDMAYCTPHRRAPIFGRSGLAGRLASRGPDASRPLRESYR